MQFYSGYFFQFSEWMSDRFFFFGKLLYRQVYEIVEEFFSDECAGKKYLLKMFISLWMLIKSVFNFITNWMILNIIKLNTFHVSKNEIEMCVE